MEQAFIDMMADTITIEPMTGQDRYTQESFGAAVTYSAHITQEVKKVQTADGKELVSTTQCYVDTTTVISPRSRITLPSRFAPKTQPQILSVRQHTDELGAHHTVIYC